MRGGFTPEYMKIALSIPTGRPRVKHVVKSFLENAVQYGYDLKNFSVYLSIDTTFKKTRVADFILHSELENKLGKIEYISPKRRKDIGEDLVNLGVETNLAISLFAGRGYSRLRNSSLLLALRDNNDVAICIDDDEVPYIPIESQEGKIRWENLDFFTPHLEALKSTDITRGPYMGYLSPIPSDLEEESFQGIWVLISIRYAKENCLFFILPHLQEERIPFLAFS